MPPSKQGSNTVFNYNETQKLKLGSKPATYIKGSFFFLLFFFFRFSFWSMGKERKLGTIVRNFDHMF